MLTRARDMGRIAKKTTDSEILNYATKVGHHQHAMSILDNPPSNAVFEFYSQQVKNAEHEKGARYTEKYGNISGLKKTKQRANNTRLSGETALHAICVDDEIGVAENLKMPATPFVAASSISDASAGKSAETHADVSEVRDIAVMQILSAKDSEQAESHQMVLEQLTRSKDKPYDQQAINSNRALVRAGQDASQRAESLAKIAGIRKRAGK